MVDQQITNRIQTPTIKEEQENYTKENKPQIKQNNESEIKIVNRSEADKWFTTLQNRYLQRGFRTNYNTVQKCLKSLFHIHNETVNIWTHIGGMLMSLFIIYFIYFYIQNSTGIEKKLQNEFQNYLDPLQNNQNIFCDQYLQQANIQNTTLLQLKEKELQNLHENIIIQYNYIKVNNDNINLYAQSTMAKIQQLAPLCENTPSHNQIYENLQNTQNIILNAILDNILPYIPFYQQTQLLEQPLHKNSKLSPDQLIYHEVHTWPLTLYQISAFLTFLGSTCFHLFNSISQKIYFKLIRLDYAGIALVLTTGCMSIYYYSYFCEPIYFYTYLIGAGSIGSIVFILSFFDFIHSYKHHKLRSFIYGSYGLMLTVPTFQAIIRSNSIVDPELTDYLDLGISSYYYLGVFVAGFGGLGLYIYRIPERFKLGYFDIIGQSHNLWHICCIIVIYCGHMGVYNNYIGRKNNICLVK